MTPETVIVIIVPLVERITQVLKSLKPLVAVDTRIVAAFVGILVAFLLSIDLFAMGGETWNWIHFPWALKVAISGYAISLGANIVHKFFNWTGINKTA